MQQKSPVVSRARSLSGNYATKVVAMIFLLAAPCVRADWKDLKEGLDPAAAEQCVGAPLFGNQTRGGTYVNWVYDNGGYILFECGHVRFWQQPSEKNGGVPSLASAPVPVASSPGKLTSPAARANRPTQSVIVPRW
jgi:hypothetical protein